MRYVVNDDDEAEAWGRARISPFPRDSDPESLNPLAASALSREGVGAEGQRACVPCLLVCRQGYLLFAGVQTQLGWRRRVRWLAVAPVLLQC